MEYEDFLIEYKDFLQSCQNQIDEKNFLEFPEEFFESIKEDTARHIARALRNIALVKLPEREIHFFEWLQQNDPAVWDDLWAGDEREPYIVSISFLPLLINKTRGFPICDLLTVDNYYFTSAFFLDEEARAFIESTRARFLDHNPLTIGQLLTVEISVDPIDIWHFAYFRNIDLAAAKKSVKGLVDDKIIAHLTDAAHIAPFVVI